MIYFVLFSRPNPVYQDSYQDSDGETATSSAKKKFAAPPAVNFPGKVVTLSTVTSVLSSVRSPTPTLSIAVYNSTYLSIYQYSADRKRQTYQRYAQKLWHPLLMLCSLSASGGSCSEANLRQTHNEPSKLLPQDGHIVNVL